MNNEKSYYLSLLGIDQWIARDVCAEHQPCFFTTKVLDDTRIIVLVRETNSPLNTVISPKADRLLSRIYELVNLSPSLLNIVACEKQTTPKHKELKSFSMTELKQYCKNNPRVRVYIFGQPLAEWLSAYGFNASILNSGQYQLLDFSLERLYKKPKEKKRLYFQLCQVNSDAITSS